ncbi:MAG: signal peptidase I [Nitrospirae bacterium]|nr:MAG: signal peptidase I [Nitrospirota bacterium]
MLARGAEVLAKEVGAIRHALAPWRWLFEHWALKLGVGVLLLIVVANAVLAPWYRLLFRVSESWPHHVVFLLERHVPVERGDLVAFPMTQALLEAIRPPEHPRPYATVGRLWMKRLVGLPGDRIEIRGDEVWVNGVSMGTVLHRDRFGVPIEHADLPAVIPPGYGYVALTDHPRSLDSRYFGLIPLTSIEGKVWPLF